MQIAKSFDSVTVKKIGKGVLIAACGGAAIYVLDFFTTVDFGNPTLAALVATVVPSLVNTIKEWLKGE